MESGNKSLISVLDHDLRKTSRESFERNSSFLEKELLKQHSLLLALTNLSPSLSEEKFDPMAIIIGTSQGMNNVLEAIKLSQEAKKKDWADKSIFIASGGIGVSKGELKATGIKGINAEVIAKMLTESGVEQKNIIIDDKSLNTPEQAENISQIIKEKGIKKAVAVVAVWHGPRFLSTMIGKMPDTQIYTRYVNSDLKRINIATHDFGQIDFQQPMFISELARFHMYVENDSGPIHPKDLYKYISRIIPKDRSNLLEQRKKIHEKLMESWDNTHTQVIDLENYVGLAEMTRPSGDFKV